MISRLASLGVSVPGGFATTADAYRDFLAQTGSRIASSPSSTGSTSTTSRGSPKPARASAADPRDPLPGAAATGNRRRIRRDERGRRGVGRSALIRHRRGPPRSVIRRPAGDAAQRPRRRQRRPGRARCATPRSSTIAPSPIACTRASTIRWSRSPPASSTWSRSDLRSSGVMFTLDTDIGIPRRRFYHRPPAASAKRSYKVPSIPTSFTSIKPALRAGRRTHPAPHPRREGIQDDLRTRPVPPERR